jgi:hypothetical protein
VYTVINEVVVVVIVWYLDLPLHVQSMIITTIVVGSNPEHAYHFTTDAFFLSQYFQSYFIYFRNDLYAEC